MKTNFEKIQRIADDNTDSAANIASPEIGGHVLIWVGGGKEAVFEKALLTCDHASDQRNGMLVENWRISFRI